MTKKKKFLFALLAASLSLVVTAGILLAVDVYYHHKMSASGGFNVWGYRGPTVARKKANEQRVIVVGESTTLGYGVHWQEALPAQLETLLNRPAPSSGRRVSVVNLGSNGDGAGAIQFTLKDYAYLDYDLVILYSGYSELAGPNHAAFRHTSPIFRLTGYMPILPLVMREKSMAIMYGGKLEAAYKGEKNVFRPSFGQRTVASVLAAAANLSESLDRQLRNAKPDPADDLAAAGAECGPRWAHYCGGMYVAVKYALDHRKKVMIATQPFINAGHVDQQQHLVAFLQHRFPNRPWLRFANLGDAVSLTDPALCFDGMHLTAAGNRVIAEKLAGPVSEMIR
jgi:lysophospholipase L1-like esterase